MLMLLVVISDTFIDVCASVESTLAGVDVNAGVESTLAGVDVDAVSVGPVVIHLLMSVLVLNQH